MAAISLFAVYALTGTPDFKDEQKNIHKYAEEESKKERERSQSWTRLALLRVRRLRPRTWRPLLDEQRA